MFSLHLEPVVERHFCLVLFYHTLAFTRTHVGSVFDLQYVEDEEHEETEGELEPRVLAEHKANEGDGELTERRRKEEGKIH